MESVDREFVEELAQALRRSALGADLRAIDEAMREMILDEMFATLDGEPRRRLGRLCSEAGGRALYAFIESYVDAIAAFQAEHPDVLLLEPNAPGAGDDDELTLPAVAPPQAGEWIRDASAALDRWSMWHLFSGDLRLRVDGGRTSTLAEAHCGRLMPVASDAAPIERTSEHPTTRTCRLCRRALVRARRRA